ncbi:MAG: hypothetical protein ACRERV_04665 [Methylococcales bacterium]
MALQDFDLLDDFRPRVVLWDPLGLVDVFFAVPGLTPDRRSVPPTFSVCEYCLHIERDWSRLRHLPFIWINSTP